MPFYTSRGIAMPRPRRKRERTLGPCEEVMAGGLSCTHPAIMRDPQTGELLCAGHERCEGSVTDGGKPARVAAMSADRCDPPWSQGVTEKGPEA